MLISPIWRDFGEINLMRLCFSSFTRHHLANMARINHSINCRFRNRAICAPKWRDYSFALYFVLRPAPSITINPSSTHFSSRLVIREAGAARPKSPSMGVNILRISWTSQSFLTPVNWKYYYSFFRFVMHFYV